jgi:hypothetical protein
VNHRARYIGARPRPRFAVNQDEPVEAEWADEPLDDEPPAWAEDFVPYGGDAA